MRMDVSKQKCFFHKVWLNECRYRYMPIYPRTLLFLYFWMFFPEEKSFAVEYCLVFDGSLFTRVPNTERVQLDQESFSSSTNVLRTNMFDSPTAPTHFSIYFSRLLEKSITCGTRKRFEVSTKKCQMAKRIVLSQNRSVFLPFSAIRPAKSLMTFSSTLSKSYSKTTRINSYSIPRFLNKRIPGTGWDWVHSF